MKISKSKQELARIISENGGWRDESESEFAAQDGDGTCSIDFFKSTPRYDKNDKYWKGEYDFCERISQSGFTIKNFHQTILSRAEYFYLYPAPDADGWIEWDCGECPVANDARIDVKLNGGIVHYNTDSMWGWKADSFKITHYRLHKPEQAKPEFCKSVVRSIPDPDEQVWTSAPTIKKLASDYRNSADYAERKQQEAYDAKADADAKLKALELAVEAIGLIVSPVTAKQEHELTITDWRDLQVGDEVEIVESCSEERVGHIGVITRFSGTDEKFRVRVHFNGNESDYEWISKWRFIRRP